MARLIDVAKAAGVSRSTASNVFNSPRIVRAELRERVEAAARELGYSGPDPKGRLLRMGKHNAIAVMPPSTWNLVDTLRNPVFNLFLQGVGAACDEAGANIVITSGRPVATGLQDALVDGVIFGRVEQLAEVEPAQLRRLPFAVVDVDPGPGINAVWVDARAGTHAAARHLLGLGHRRFAILSFLRETGPARAFPAGAPRSAGAAGISTDQDKYRGYADALAEAGLDIADVPMLQADVYDPTAPGRLLDMAPEATAILSMAVMQGIGVIEEAARRGLSVPGDLSVVGYNDIPQAARCTPPLTTVDGMGVEKGQAAARLVLGGGPPHHEIIEPRLIMRGSTGPASRSSAPIRNPTWP